MAHTPAPWRIGGEYSNSLDEIEDADGRAIAVVWTRSAPERATAREQFKDVPHLKGNARLFAAAPELLHLCEYLFELVQKQVDDMDYDYDQIVAVINKAKGEI